MRSTATGRRSTRVSTVNLPWDPDYSSDRHVQRPRLSPAASRRLHEPTRKHRTMCSPVSGQESGMGQIVANMPKAGSSSSEADAPGLSPHEPCLASAQGRELVIALSLRVVWWSVIWGTCIVHTCQVQTKWLASKRMPSSWTQVLEQSHLTDMLASTLWKYFDLSGY
jgi:hypothetical protein